MQSENVSSGRIYTVTVLVFLCLAFSANAAEKPSAREVEICLQTIKDMTDGNPPQSAIALCQQGKLDAAIDEALSGG